MQRERLEMQERAWYVWDIQKASLDTPHFSSPFFHRGVAGFAHSDWVIHLQSSCHRSFSHSFAWHLAAYCLLLQSLSSIFNLSKSIKQVLFILEVLKKPLNSVQFDNH